MCWTNRTVNHWNHGRQRNQQIIKRSTDNKLWIAVCCCTPQKTAINTRHLATHQCRSMPFLEIMPKVMHRTNCKLQMHFATHAVLSTHPIGDRWSPLSWHTQKKFSCKLNARGLCSLCSNFWKGKTGFMDIRQPIFISNCCCASPMARNRTKNAPSVRIFSRNRMIQPQFFCSTVNVSLTQDAHQIKPSWICMRESVANLFSVEIVFMSLRLANFVSSNAVMVDGVGLSSAGQDNEYEHKWTSTHWFRRSRNKYNCECNQKHVYYVVLLRSRFTQAMPKTRQTSP